MKKKSIIDKIVDSGRGAAVAAGAGYGTSKVIDSVLRVSRNDPKTIGKFGFILTGLSFLIGGILYAFYWSKKRNDAKAYEIERRADGDLIQLRWCNITSDGRLNYQMGKNHKDRDLVLVAQAKDILHYYYKDGVKPSDYIFPLLDINEPWAKAVTQEEKDVLPVELKKRMLEQISSKNALINKELAKIVKKVGLEKRLTLHISRHSFARAAKERGLDNLAVKSLLAHSNVSTTERYMGNFDTAANDAALEAVFVNEKKDVLKEELLEQLRRLDAETLKSLLSELNK